jgi:pyridoxine 5-phosphate synthase
LRVTLFEQGPHGRDKVCGDGLTPRAVAALGELKIDLAPAHRIDGLRMIAGKKTRELAWPASERFPGHGAVWPRQRFDNHLMDVAADLVARNLPLHQLTFVPDGEGQLTSDHGWSFPQDDAVLRPLIAQSQAWGVRVSLFMDAEADAMAGAKAVGADRVELYTEPYAAAWGSAGAQAQLERFAQAARAATAAGLGINAGHDLNLDNLTAFIKMVPEVREVSIGHALIGDALERGYSSAVKAYLACLRP